MKVKITQTAIVDIKDKDYINWLVGNDDNRDFTYMTNTQKLEVIKECEEECGYEIVQRADDWSVKIELA